MHLFYFFTTQFISAQNFSVEIPDNNTAKFQNLLMKIDDINFENFKFINNDTSKNYNYKLIISEYKNGAKTKDEILFESNPDLKYGNFENNALTFSIMGKPINNKNYKMVLNINSNLNLEQNFQLIDAYQFEIKHFFNQNMKFIPGEKTLLFALVKPIKVNDNTYRNCDFGSEKLNSNKWFKIFGIDNYVTIEIIFD